MTIEKKQIEQPGKVKWSYTRDKYLEIKFHCPIDQMMPMWMPKKVTLVWAGCRYDIFEHDMFCFSRSLRECFELLLDNKRPLKKSVSDPKQMGYLYNQVREYKISYKKVEFMEDYIVRHATAKRRRFVIWLYNDEQGQIIFHMGERYSDVLKRRGLSYRSFIRTYEPLFVEVIPHEVVRSWLTQSNALEHQLQENERAWDIEHERLKREGKCEECLEEAAADALRITSQPKAQTEVHVG